ncbi:MAG: hypothetical protein WEB00_12420 [Dehalococcoidia bacterium]
MIWPDLRPILVGIPWATVGAVATRLYTSERATGDIDVAVPATDYASAKRRLEDAGFNHVSELTIGGSGWVGPDGTHIDLIEGREPWWPDALSQAQNNPDQQSFPTLPLPYLVLMKLQASRLIDMGDLGRMLGVASDYDFEAVRRVVSKYAPELVEDLESIRALGRLEHEGAP